MAKDTRGNGPRKEVTKGGFIFRLSLAATAIVLGTALIVVAVVWGFRQSGAGSPTDTTTAESTATEAVTTTAQTTVTTVTETTMTVTTTTTTVTTTTTSAPPATSANVPWNLRLVNKWTPMTQAESETLPIATLSGAESVDSRIIEPLNRMLGDASQYGLWVTSSYRSYSTQERLYNNKVQRVISEQGCSYEDALVIAATEVAAPGTSEHNTGLAVDLLYTGMWELEEYWEDGEAFDWLMAHCHEYGFILRFPKGKEAITGVIYEPWHYRYVGVEAATYIMQNGITLEEYVQQQGLY